MKTKLSILTAALVLLGRLEICQGQNSPAGTWDCVFNGSHQTGIAILSFTNETEIGGTFGGYMIETIVPLSSTSSDGRTRGDGGRGSGSDSSNTNSVEKLFGFGPISGPWHFDAKGRIIGSFIQITGDETVVPVSFIGRVNPGKRLTFVASTTIGTISFKGVPYAALPDISGTWAGVKKQNGVSYNETFTLTPSGFFENIYQTGDGTGPGYDFTGYAVVSSQKRMGFAFAELPLGSTNEVLRATVGKVSTKNALTAKTIGTTESSDTAPKLTFDASFLSP